MRELVLKMNMATEALKRVFNPHPEKSGSSIHIVKLSDLKDQDVKDLELPSLCKTVCRKRDGGRRHCQAADILDKVMKNQGKAPSPILCCCYAAAKLVTTPTSNGVYCIFTRSPLPHVSHWYRLNKSTKMSLEDIKSLWFELPPFGANFVGKALQQLSLIKDAPSISPEAKTAIEKLANAYGQYEFDMVLYDTMQAISNLSNRTNSLVEVRFISRPKRIPLVRVLFANVGGDEEDAFIPIIGFAVEGQSVGERQSKELKAIATVIDEKAKERGLKPLRSGPMTEKSGKWNFEIKIRTATDTQEDNNWSNQVKKLVISGVEVGTGTYFHRLEAMLPSKQSEFWKDFSFFREQLSVYRERLDSTFRNNGTVALHPFVLKDIEDVGHRLSKERIEDTSMVSLVINTIIKSLQEYPPQMPSPEGSDGRSRLGLLYQDVLKGEKNYLEDIKKRLFVLEDQLYEEDASSLRKVLLSFYADLPAELLQWLSLGMLKSYEIRDSIRASAYHKYVKRRVAEVGVIPIRLERAKWKNSAKTSGAILQTLE